MSAALSPEFHALQDKLEARQARVAVIGLGYVGLPLAVALGQAGLMVVGVDVNAAKCAQLNAGQSSVGDVSSAVLAELVAAGRLYATPDYAALDDVDVVTISVPTPLGKSKAPDISYIVQAADALAPHVHRGMLIVLESTTYPGTTEEILLPRLRTNGLRVGQDVFLAFSPERVDPGNVRYGIHNTPKVVGGLTPACSTLAQAFYGLIVERVVPVSSPAAAEMTKLLENTFRAVNIGLVNEMAQICHRIGIDIWEVVAAAATKPFGFMPFYPGPGLGGHCIPVDPLYLTWKMRGLGMQTRFIELADTINTDMPLYVVRRVQDALNDEGRALRRAKVLVLGVAYKRDVADVRESPALTIIDDLQTRGALVSYHDPHVASIATLTGERMESAPLTQAAVAAADCILIHTDHSAFDWAWLGRTARLILDTRHTPVAQGAAARVVSL